MHVFDEDFYGAELRVCVAGYIREERKFPSLGERDPGEREGGRGGGKKG